MISARITWRGWNELRGYEALKEEMKERSDLHLLETVIFAERKDKFRGEMILVELSSN